MTIQHKGLATGGWSKLTLPEQLANVGSEVERTISWREKGNYLYSRKAFERALELLSLTKNSHKDETSLKEITRIYEFLVDYFDGKNLFASTDETWRNYFRGYTYFSRIKL